jgi:hypothetical protein
MYAKWNSKTYVLQTFFDINASLAIKFEKQAYGLTVLVKIEFGIKRNRLCC